MWTYSKIFLFSIVLWVAWLDSCCNPHTVLFSECSGTGLTLVVDGKEYNVMRMERKQVVAAAPYDLACSWFVWIYVHARDVQLFSKHRSPDHTKEAERTNYGFIDKSVHFVLDSRVGKSGDYRCR